MDKEISTKPYGVIFSRVFIWIWIIGVVFLYAQILKEKTSLLDPTFIFFSILIFFFLPLEVFVFLTLPLEIMVSSKEIKIRRFKKFETLPWGKVEKIREIYPFLFHNISGFSRLFLIKSKNNKGLSNTFVYLYDLGITPTLKFFLENFYSFAKDKFSEKPNFMVEIEQRYGK